MNEKANLLDIPREESQRQNEDSSVSSVEILDQLPENFSPEKFAYYVREFARQMSPIVCEKNLDKLAYILTLIETEADDILTPKIDHKPLD